MIGPCTSSVGEGQDGLSRPLSCCVCLSIPHTLALSSRPSRCGSRGARLTPWPLTSYHFLLICSKSSVKQYSQRPARRLVRIPSNHILTEVQNSNSALSSIHGRAVFLVFLLIGQTRTPLLDQRGCTMPRRISWDPGSSSRADGFGFKFSFYFFYRVIAKLSL